MKHKKVIAFGVLGVGLVLGGLIWHFARPKK